jgi:hypothetical protein
VRTSDRRQGQAYEHGFSVNLSSNVDGSFQSCRMVLPTPAGVPEADSDVLMSEKSDKLCRVIKLSLYVLSSNPHESEA